MEHLQELGRIGSVLPSFPTELFHKNLFVYTFKQAACFSEVENILLSGRNLTEMKCLLDSVGLAEFSLSNSERKHFRDKIMTSVCTENQRYWLN